VKCTISGSFRKFYTEIVKLIDEFNSLGIEVLSPKKSKILNPEEEFVVLESDSKDKNVKQSEEKHLEAIKNSDFLYICNGWLPYEMSEFFFRLLIDCKDV